MAGRVHKINPTQGIDPGRRYEQKCAKLADRLFWDDAEPIWFCWQQVAVELLYRHDLPVSVAGYHAFTLVEGMFDKQGASPN